MALCDLLLKNGLWISFSEDLGIHVGEGSGLIWLCKGSQPQRDHLQRNRDELVTFFACYCTLYMYMCVCLYMCTLCNVHVCIHTIRYTVQKYTVRNMYVYNVHVQHTCTCTVYMYMCTCRSLFGLSSCNQISIRWLVTWYSTYRYIKFCKWIHLYMETL